MSGKLQTILIIVAALLMLGGAALVGVVKFMAWWNIAFGACVS